jgi:hypothetical protein
VRKRLCLPKAVRDFIKDGVKLKNLLIILIICLGAWPFFSKGSIVAESSKNFSETTLLNNSAVQTLAKAKTIAKQKPNFKCDGRQHCSQMNSYAEAKYFIQHCPNTKMDGDNDGIPCERQFNK